MTDTPRAAAPPRKASAKTNGGVSRRNFLAASASTSAAAFGEFAFAARAEAQAAAAAEGMTTVPVSLSINGTGYDLMLDARATVLDLLREELNLTGTKVGCNHGQCGACTVLMNGVRVNSCLTLAATAQGAEITTVEGLAGPDGTLHPMQQAFVDRDGFQCGYCTPGQIVSAIGCVKEGHAETEGEVREYMSGNLCRCGAYKGITEAVLQARDATRQSTVGEA